MEVKFGDNLKSLSLILGKPIYVVGGYVRNHLIDKSISSDIDLAGAISAEELCSVLASCGFTPVQVYKRTGTVVFCKDDQKYEFTTFRKESYNKGGEHTPTSTEFTLDINEDARRRDFKCNAIYYDVIKNEIVDPLGGVEDIKNKVLDTVVLPDQVFCHDGLRLMRLARFSGELNFTPTKEVLISAKKHAKNIKDISAERVYDELIKILHADKKYHFSDKKGHYAGLKILDETRVLDYIIPELTLGRNMEQRADFHDHDVLEHTLRSVLYASEDIRLSALFHDVGKPYCKQKFGVYHSHADYGEGLAREILSRLKAPNKVIKEVCFLTKNHMKDINGNMKEANVRKLLCLNFNYAEKLIKLMQADYSGCKDDLSVAPAVAKWKKILEYIVEKNIPKSERELKLKSTDLIELGIKGEELGRIRKDLLMKCIENPDFNDREKILKYAKDNLGKYVI